MDVTKWFSWMQAWFAHEVIMLLVRSAQAVICASRQRFCSSYGRCKEMNVLSLLGETTASQAEAYESCAFSK